MKKIYSFVFAAVALFAAASCQKEIVNAPEVKGEAFRFTATRDTETKTIMSGDRSVSWTVGDKLSVFDVNAEVVTFNNTETVTSESATFYAEKFVVPADGSIYAVYPDHETAGASAYKLIENGVKNLRIGGGQTAVAGSFDPKFGVAYAYSVVTDPNTAPTMKFKNLHSLVKFTIDPNSDVPTNSVTLTNNGNDNFAGGGVVFDGEKITPPEAGAKTVTLTGNFEAGKTYYFSVWPVDCQRGLTLAMDGKEILTTSDVTLEANKIYNLGTVAMPTDEPEVPEFENDFAKRLWGKYAPNADGWIVMGAGNLDRGMAMDNQYIYISKSTAYDPVIKAFNLDGTEAFDCNVTGMGSSNEWGDAMLNSVNCVRTIKKNDGSYVLLACNLKLDASHVLQVWAWENGPQTAPKCIARYAYDNLAKASDHRRYGDRFNVTGTWEDGLLWFPSMQADDHGKTIVFSVKNGVVTGHLDKNMGPLYYYRMEPSQSNMKDLAFYPGYDEVFSTCNGNAKFVKLDGTTHSSTGWINWAVTDDYSATHTRTFGYNFFEVDGKKYIAYVKIDEQNGRTGRLVVIEDEVSDFKTALTANITVFEAPLQHTSDFTFASAATTGSTLGNCNVVVKDGITYIGAHIQGLGLSLFQVK